ncbi:hypothetical protein BU24DRAFT_449347 [Aaosphaeria arxii CBS 175.79]|uniref:Uncharacterized protein n=1 Tax=Aaosphaeria arxii CBS 175.79 TaxID=1450172 RepID=A0A6A5XWN2_9PLEO|nr:uncharacterized protein BU24DRAFT_449347 [Aaosphaeria arxii CBS 175.79]KAF2017738.1 hypothetical protein BU24DRAFT_449347 [Aaosphaeria arxii CBS 175.79]
MSNPNRTSYNGPPLSGPGIMWVNSAPRSQLDEAVFNQWYQTVHIPDIIAATPSNSPGCTAAWRFRSSDNSRKRPHLAIYNVPDMSFIESAEFKSISQHSELLPESGPSQDYINFDTRFYQQVQVFTKPEVSGIEDGSGEMGKVIKSTAIQPEAGMGGELDRWYRQEHLEQISQLPGWRRSKRYELIFKVQSKNDPDAEKAPKHLAIHEFKEGIDVKGMAKDEWTAWTRRVIEHSTSIDEGVFELVWECKKNDVTSST